MNWSLEQYWEECHRRGHSSLSSPTEVVQQHNLAPYLDGSDKLIMEIGIGSGDLIRHLGQRHKMTAVDVAASALKNVEEYAERRLLTMQMIDLPDSYYNLSIAHLVLQHCEDHMVQFIIQQALRTTKRSGVFSFQFAYLGWGTELEPDGGWYGDRENVGRYLFFRTPDTMREIVDHCGGDVDWASGQINHQQIAWQIFHARRKPCT